MQEQSYQSDNIPPANRNGSEKNFLVCGIGASAGGVAALKTFFENVPQDSGISYIVILHLSPDYDSQLASVLQSSAKIPVNRVVDRVILQPDNVYVVSQNQSLSIRNDAIVAKPLHTIEERRAPVDIFFRSLADTFHSRAVCVVLSGTGANGSMGLKRIKENGGAAFVQNPREAEFNEMPRNSIATDLVDAILPVSTIPAKILEYRKNAASVDLPADIHIKPEDHQQALREIFTQLRLHTGHDFSNYKKATILRRIERRMNVHSFTDIRLYANYVRDSKEEGQMLLKDLLISVTNFFRDKEAFEHLENEIIPRMLSGKSSEHRIRIWIAGCATGEEAYSIAILIAEKILNVPETPKVQIFATDIDEDALAQAREGVYSLNDAADVSPDRLQRFFNKEEDGYRVRRDIREMILFANHNLIKDPPFSKLDMVTCRNVLIYLNSTAQLRLLETFHFALNPGGFVFLGSAESLDTAGDLYVPVSKEHHIYQSRQVTPRSIPVPDIQRSFNFQPPTTQETSQLHEKRMLERITYNDLHLQLLEQYAPPSVLINQDFDVVHFSENAGRYMLSTGGEPSNNLLKIVRQELRLELRSALYEAVQRQKNLELKNLKVTVNDKTENLNIHIRPVLHPTDTSRGYILVIFEKSYELHDSTSEESSISFDNVAKQLEEELLRSKAQLRGAIEQYEVQTEELKASNEELQAMNEELRSSTEELETSKEELQSINEELTTVNQELKVKIEELSQSNNNFLNLINSTDIGTIFLDRSFRVNLFTPAARRIFNLMGNDIGRPLSDFSNRLIDVDILKFAEVVLENLQTIEHEVYTNDGKVYMMRTLPYRTSEDRINGVVLTFIDITRRKKAEIELSQSEENLRLVLDTIADYAIITIEPSGKIIGWNNGATKIFGYTVEEISGKNFALLFTPEDRENKVHLKELDTVRLYGRAEDERWHLRNDGSRFFASGVVTKMKDGKSGYVKIARDMTQNRILEQQKDEFIVVASHELKTPVTSIKAYAEVLLEQLEDEGHEETLGMVRKLNKQVDRLSGLINDLLDTTKISEGQLMLNPEKFDLNKLIQECRDNFMRIAFNHKIDIDAGKIPEVYADRERIEQVLTNLLSNAIKYSPNGGKINITSRLNNGNIQVQVTDNGIGISEEAQKMLFSKFFRSKSSTISTYPGLGLGLYISAEIIKRHNGSIAVESHKDNGSTFVFTLPLGVP